jgi:hypothetical protein
MTMSERDSSTVEIAIDYIKERIESPFLMSFLVSWGIINRDFVFYLFLADAKDKYRTLADWDFSSFVFGWYSPVGDSFIYPLFFGALITLFFSAISMSFSGARYSVTSFFKRFAQDQKSRYDNILEITKAKVQFDLLTKDVKELEEKKNILLKNLVYETSSLEEVRAERMTQERYRVFEFVSIFTSFHLRYLPDLSEYNWNPDKVISPSCKVVISVSLFDSNGKLTNDSSTFRGFFADFILNSGFFDLDDEKDAIAASRILNAPIKSEGILDTKSGKIFFQIHEITVPERLM